MLSCIYTLTQRISANTLFDPYSKHDISWNPKNHSKKSEPGCFILKIHGCILAVKAKAFFWCKRSTEYTTAKQSLLAQKHSNHVYISRNNSRILPKTVYLGVVRTGNSEARSGRDLALKSLSRPRTCCTLFGAAKLELYLLWMTIKRGSCGHEMQLREGQPQIFPFSSLGNVESPSQRAILTTAMLKSSIWYWQIKNFFEEFLNRSHLAWKW